MVATKHDLNIMSNNMNVNQAKSFSIDFSSTGYSISPTSIPVEFMDMASYSFQFSSENNAKDEDSSPGNLLTSTFSLEFSSATTSSSLPYLRRE
jgi:hypothetical protein